MHKKMEQALVYACSGASSAAQMANHIAVKLDRLKVAEMSCIAGVGGDVKPLVKTALSGRPIIALDGCPLQYAAKILARHGLKADKHLDLSDLGVKKRMHEDFDPQEASRVLQELLAAPDFPGRAPVVSASGAGMARPEAKDAEVETAEPASPVCYLAGFDRSSPKSWVGGRSDPGVGVRRRSWIRFWEEVEMRPVVGKSPNCQIC